ncbi:hypothetical protein N7461_001892 [Penicillium sp. DV-2018c]|nr:hypothetical protein N7461_001892 [Penicillium sp. DV-2018c]
MSSRFPPSSGFNSRDRSPQRFGDRRPPVGPRGPDDAPAPFGRDPPRGPRALVDSPRGGHFGGRGRGYGRGDFRDRDRDPRDRDFRDNRDGQSFRRDMDRDWVRRDREFDPRDNRIGFGRGRSRSPTRDFRDMRDPPARDFDLIRMRRNSRDSILSASSGGPDGPPANIGHIPRGAMRGRGRADWEGGRGRGRPPFFDDRDLFRRRSRSREPWRGRDRLLDRDRDRVLDRDRAVDRDRIIDRDRDRDIPRPRDREREQDRDLDRRDRFDRREDRDIRRPDREDRDRPVDFWKRERPPSRAASGSTTSSRPPTATGPGSVPALPDRLPDHAQADQGRKASTQSNIAAPETAHDLTRDETVPARLSSVRSDIPRDDTSRFNAARPDAARPDAARPDAARPDAPRPDAARPDAARPDPTRPDAARSDAARPGTALPDTTRPDTARPDTARPDTARPDTARPDPTRPDAARPDLPTDPGPIVRRSPPLAVPQVPPFGSGTAPLSTTSLSTDSSDKRVPLDSVLPSLPPQKEHNELAQRRQPHPPTGPKAERTERSEITQPLEPRRPETHRELGKQKVGPSLPPKSSTHLPDISPPTAPAAMTRPDPVLGPSDGFVPGRSDPLTRSPTFARIPQRARSREPSISPRMQPSGIPTGPRALQRQAPSPRGRKGSKQWVRPGYGRTPPNTNALPKQESLDDREAIPPINENKRRAHHPLPSPDIDGPESGEILPTKPARNPSPVSMNLPLQQLPLAAQSRNSDDKGVTGQAGVDKGVLIPTFEGSSDEEDGENVIFTQEYLDERRRLFEKDMETLRAELPPSPLEDAEIVALLLRIQLLGMVANSEKRQPPTEQPAEPPAGDLSERPVNYVPSLESEVPTDHPSSGGMTSSAHEIPESEPEPITDTVIPPMVSSGNVTVETLPFLHTGPPTPIQDMAVYRGNIATQNRLKDKISAELSKIRGEVFRKNAILRDEYLAHYKLWRLAIWELDRTKDKDKKLVTPGPASPSVSTVPTTPAPMPEGREGRRYKGNSELDFLNALKASEISAQEELERRRTKSATAQPDLVREAVIPNMLEPREKKACVYKDVNNTIDCSRALDVFGFAPPPNDFTPEEHAIFTDAFMAHPKLWGKIAESLPGRNFQQCIIHYYLTKEEIKYKAKLNKRWSKRGRGARKGPRPKSNALIADLGVVKPDFAGEDEPPAVTDTGRPRRAAAPTFGDSTEVESVPSGRRGQTGKDRESVERSTPRRGGRGGNSRGGRRVKNPQPEPKAQVAMPQGNLRPDVPPAPPRPASETPLVSDNTMEAFDAREAERTEKDSLPPVPRGRVGRGKAKEGVYVFESTEVEPVATKQPETGYGSLQPTSYWSVPEQRDFPALLGHFGRDFEGISSWMKTKTTVMVKNFYQRRLDSGQKDFEMILTEAEEKKARGEPTGPLPVPSVAPKRRYEATPSSIIPRPLAPQGDTMADVEDPRYTSKGRPVGLSPQPIPMHGRPLSEKERSLGRYQPLAQASASSAVPSTATLIEESTRAIRAQGGPSHRIQGPRLGYFTEDRRDSSVMAHSSPRTQDLPIPSLHPGSMPPEMVRMDHLSSQAYMPPQQPPPILSSNHSRHPSSPNQQLRPELDMSSFHRDNFAQRSYYPLTGPPGGIPQSPRPGLSPVKDVPRPSATPGPEAARHVPAKRSNIMSILNDEPEEPQPRKRFAGEQGTSAPTVTTSITSRPTYQASGSSRQEDTSMPGLPQKSASYAQQSQYQPTSRGYADYSGYGPPHSGAGTTSANNDWMARFDPRAQQNPAQAQAQPAPAQQQQQSQQQQQQAQSSRQGPYSSYSVTPNQPSVPPTNIPVPSPAPTPPPSVGPQRSAYSNVYSQPSSAQAPMSSGARDIASQPPSYRPGSPGPRSNMAFGTRQDPPMTAQSPGNLYGMHSRQSASRASYPSAAQATQNPAQAHSYQQHVQTMVSGSHQPQSHRSTPVNLPSGSSQYGHDTPPPQSQPGRSIGSLASLGRSYTPPAGLHSSMSGPAMGSYAPSQSSTPGSIPLLHQRPPGSLGDNVTTPTHHRVYSHGSVQGGLPGSLPPPSQPR